MRTLILVTSAMLLVACGKGDESKGSAPAKDPASAPAANATDARPAKSRFDAAAPRLDAAVDPLEGKKTGLGAKDEIAEVVTEALIVAIASGQFDASRVIDPAVAVYQVVSLPGAREKPAPDKRKRLCGAKAKSLLRDYAKTLDRRQTQGKDEANPDYSDHIIYCDNTWLHHTGPAGGDDVRMVPHPQQYAVCGSSGASEWDSSYDLLFVPDATRGVRFAGVLESESGGEADEALAYLAQQIAAPAACK